MTTVDKPPEPLEPVLLTEMDHDSADPVAPSRLRRRRRRPAPKANIFWRFMFPVLVVAAAVGVVFLLRHGTKVVLDSTDGELVEIVTDPTQPGFEAFVDPTPTMLLLHLDGDELVGVTVMARTLLDNGGQIVLLSADLLITSDLVPDVEDVRLSELYSEGGSELVGAMVSDMFGFGFIETGVITTEQLGDLMTLVEPIPFGLLSDLRRPQADGSTTMWLAHGELQLDGTTAAEVYSFRNQGEADANRNERQLDLWASWLGEIGRADDLSAAALFFDDGLSPYLRAFGPGSVDISLLPAGPVWLDDGRPVYVLDEDQLVWLSETARRMVPLPISPPNADQPRIRLLNGTDDPARRQVALEALVDLGVEVAVLGNVSQFGATQSVVIYYRVADEDRAQQLASWAGAHVEFREDSDQLVDLTVVVGADWPGS